MTVSDDALLIGASGVCAINGTGEYPPLGDALLVLAPEFCCC